MVLSKTQSLSLPAFVSVAYIGWITEVWFLTEVLSAFTLLSPLAIQMNWALLAIFLFIWRSTWWSAAASLFRFFQTLPGIFVGLILGCSFLQGILSPPNTTDTLVYHLTRMMFWLSAGTSWQYATVTNHDYMSPLSGYVFLQWFGLLANDRLVFMTQWLAGCICLLCTYYLARTFSQKRMDAFWSVAWTSSLPTFVFQLSSTQIDLFSTSFLLTALVLCLEWKVKRSSGLLFATILSIGLAVFAKLPLVFWITGFGLPLLIVTWPIWRRREYWGEIGLGMVAIVGLLGRWLWQNVMLFGHPLGKHLSGEQELGFINATFPPALGLIHWFGNIALHVPFLVVARPVNTFISNALYWWGSSTSDTRFIWVGETFRVPTLLFPQEDIVGSTILVSLMGLTVFGWRYRTRLSDRLPEWMFWGGWLSWWVFSSTLIWQPFHVRLHLPLLVVMSIFVSLFWSQQRWWRWLVTFSVIVTFGLMIANVSRPFISYQPVKRYIQPFLPSTARIPTSLFFTSREEQYFHPGMDWRPVMIELKQWLQDNQIRTIAVDVQHGLPYLLWPTVFSPLDIGVVSREKADAQLISGRDLAIQQYDQCWYHPREKVYVCIQRLP